jgi:TRAP-type C4-dicarboxylate transport system permease large subunit
MLARSAPGTKGGGMHSAPILAPQPVGAALHRAQWERTIAGYVVDVIEPVGMLAIIGLALGCFSRSRCKGFLAFVCLALALTAARRLNNAIVSWSDLQSLKTYSVLATVLWAPTSAGWALAWNRW